MKKIPYWIKGILAGLVVIILGVIVFSSVAASSSLCGQNISGPGESHACDFSDRLSLFFGLSYLMLIEPFILTTHNLVEYHSWKMFVNTDDLFYPFLIQISVVTLSGILGYVYGKLKNHRSNYSGVRI